MSELGDLLAEIKRLQATVELLQKSQCEQRIALTRAEAAQACGISYRTAHDLEATGYWTPAPGPGRVYGIESLRQWANSGVADWSKMKAG